jgi:hypothetical protein
MPTSSSDALLRIVIFLLLTTLAIPLTSIVGIRVITGGWIDDVVTNSRSIDFIVYPDSSTTVIYSVPWNSVRVAIALIIGVMVILYMAWLLAAILRSRNNSPENGDQ